MEKDKDSNKGFELDLSDISTSKSVVKEEVEAPKGPIEPTGYIVKSTQNEEGKWVHTDLAELTEDEFHAWAKTIFPFHEELEKTKFNTRASKLKVLQNIMEFHKAAFLSAKRSKDKEYIH